VITLEFLAGYWTACVDGAPIVSFASYERAIEMVPEAARPQGAAA
jgi:hypothetical protein